MQDIRRTSPGGGVPPVRNSALDSDRQKPPSVARSRFYSGYTRLRTLESFQHRDFGVLWAAMFCMSITGWIINITAGWLTYELTSSPLLTGLAIGMGAVPPIIIAPIAGVLIDSLDRKTVMIAAMASFAFFVGVFGVIVILGILQPWHIFAVSFLMGVSGSFLLPGRAGDLGERRSEEADGQCIRAGCVRGKRYPIDRTGDNRVLDRIDGTGSLHHACLRLRVGGDQADPSRASG